MYTSPWALALWIASFVASIGVLVMVIIKRRWKSFPVFSSFIAFQVLRTVALFAVRNLYNNKELYFVLFWSLAACDYLLQLALIVEIGLAVLRPSLDRVPKSAESTSRIRSALAVALAAVICMLLPASSLTNARLWDMRVSLFTSFVTCQCYLAILNTLKSEMRQWRSHALAIGNGLAAWSAIALIADASGALTGWRRDVPIFDRIKISVWIFVSVYWTVALWLDEPEKRKLDLIPSGITSQVDIGKAG